MTGARISSPEELWLVAFRLYYTWGFDCLRLQKQQSSVVSLGTTYA